MSWCKCGNAGPKEFTREACHICWLQCWYSDLVPPLQAPKLAPRMTRAKPCVHRSERPVRHLPGCGMCRVYGCELHGECMVGGNRHGLRNCLDPASCGDYAREKPTWPITFDHKNLAVGKKGKRFNASLIAWGDGYILAYRDGWCGSEIWTIQLDRSFRPHGEPVLADMRIEVNRVKKWRCPGCSYGREDPRLFIHHGQLHLSFIGVEGRRGGVRTNQCFARLREDRIVDDAWQVNVPNRRDWEKNWGMFEHGDELFAVYLSQPRHKIARIECSKATIVHDEPNPFPWVGGEIRGGAPPVRVGDVYWHFAHDRITQNGRWLYRTLLLEFDGKPPFAPLRMVREPIQVADPSTQPANDRNYCDVLFVGGAVRVGDDWILCSGEHDRQIRLDKFSHADLDRRLG